jgi:hypothetical protein
MEIAMRRPSLVLVSLALACGARCPALDNANAPDAEHAPVVREVEPFIAAIPVRNPYDRAVKVKLLDPTCSCATLEMKDTFILPHQAALMNIAVIDQDRSGPQHVGVSVFLTDPELETIEVMALWQVRACVQVDAIAPGGDPLKRPDDPAWRDVYRYVAKVRPDEPKRLAKRVRLSCPPEELPAGGLKVEGIDYAGTLWKFTPTVQADGSILVAAGPRDPAAELKAGEYDEPVVVRTNHPDKARIQLRFLAVVAKDIGARGIDGATLGQ